MNRCEVTSLLGIVGLGWPTKAQAATIPRPDPATPEPRGFYADHRTFGRGTRDRPACWLSRTARMARWLRRGSMHDQRTEVAVHRFHALAARAARGSAQRS